MSAEPVNQPLAIFLMGPTAAGKTDLALALTKVLPCDIISVDSALIYRGMDIGTAKPDAAVLAQAPHRLIDLIEPSASYSVAEFYRDALAEMQKISAAGRIPLLVGGTMMYFRILKNGLAALPAADEQVRQQIVADAKLHGWAYVHQQLAEVDPTAAARIKPSDPQRLQRALEVYRVSGRTMTELWAEQKSQERVPGIDQDTGKGTDTDYTNWGGSISALELDQGLAPVPYEVLSLALAPKQRSELHERIALRFRAMIAAGFIDEVAGLYHSGKVNAAMPSMKCVGYRQVWDYLAGILDYEQMVERGIIATRQLAKRQLTWLRSWPNLHWLETGDVNIVDQALNIIQQAASKGS